MASWHEGGRETIENLELEYGEFGETVEILRKASGRDQCNIRLTQTIEEEWKDQRLGVVSDGGETLYLTNSLDTVLESYVRITEEEARELGKNITNIDDSHKRSSDSDHGDPISAPPGPYKVQPKTKGRFLWIDGAPGTGKSTVAQLLAREKGW